MKKLRSENDYDIMMVDLFERKDVHTEFMAGQIAVLRQIGVGDAVVTEADMSAPPGTMGVIAVSKSGELLGGDKIYQRMSGRTLPIESDASPLPLQARASLSNESNLCEIRSLWITPDKAGRLISRKILGTSIELARQLGFSGIVSFAHWRSYKFVGAPLGYELEESIEPVAYPDERFRSVVIRHRLGAGGTDE